MPTIQRLRVFISYPGSDGLYKARQVATILSQYGHKPWLYEQHSTLGVPPFREIAVCIRKKTDVLLYICTDSSLTSWGQQLEAGYALSNRNVKILVISLNNAQIPDELTAFNYARAQDSQFQQRLQIITGNLPINVERIQRLDKEVKVTIT